MKKHWLVALGIIVLIIIILSPNKPAPNTDLVDIKQQITNMEKSLPAMQPSVDVSPLKQEIKQLNALINDLQDKSEQYHGDNQAKLINKIDGIQHILQSLDDNRHPVKYLDEKDLPFQVISIDSIQQVSVATAAYDHKTMPLEAGDTLAGWKVIKVDFAEQFIDLENADHAHIAFHLKSHEDASND